MFKAPSLYAAFTRLPKKEKFILYVVIFFISLVVLDRLIISPVFSRMKSLDKEIRLKESEVKKNLRILAQKDRILAENARYSSFLNTPESGEDQAASLMKEIENYADKASVYLVDMKPASMKETGASKKYLINLNCEAQMEQLIRFMYNIENSKELLTIEKCQISPKAKESSVAICSMVISKIITL
ncbi:MAG: GspMb/PilO family protein [Candidatus Omnitrophica bacterium]|nr:GspMb/PilO family protein [Candidatus Omnitrophota bacterium]MDD5477066.1 GspMb/PilO family protein [Candidatus Omnitrophota bacterium]